MSSSSSYLVKSVQLAVLFMVGTLTFNNVDGFVPSSLPLSSTKISAESTTTSSTSLYSSSSRRDFFGKTAASVAAAAATAGALVSGNPSPSLAAATAAPPQVYKLNSGVKYAVLKEPTNKGGYPQNGDIIAIEYTGYLTNGQIFDASHAEGKSNALLFKLGSNAVIPGINEMVSEMKVGQKVQAIIPASEAFGDKGICLDDGECLVKPGSTLVYDIYLKKASIPPP